jgi:DNA-binding SARP family transcriptional activator
VEFFLLGPVEARVGDRVVSLGRRRERLLLGVLLLQPGRLMSIDRLVDLLWETDPGPGVRANLHSNMARLRSVLNPHGVQIATVGGAYRIDVDPAAVDVHRFRGHIERARPLTNHQHRAAMLRHALGLWRGPLLADAADDRLRERLGADLAELRLAAIEACAESDLAGRRTGQAVLDLMPAVAEHPTRERLTSLPMLALYRDGRQAEALEAYARIRDVLGGELGLDPSAELTAMHDRILRDDSALLLPAEEEPGGHHRRFLPRDVPGFIGRAAELDRLTELARPATAASLVVITAVVGTPGVGKTITDF